MVRIYLRLKAEYFGYDRVRDFFELLFNQNND